MTDTAKLLSAMGNTKIHAFKPDEVVTLCGMDVIEPSDWDGTPPIRSADIIYKDDVEGRGVRPVRFYTGRNRGMCKRCVKEADYVRMDPEAVIAYLDDYLVAVE